MKPRSWSRTSRGFFVRNDREAPPPMAGWQSGYAAACKAVYLGSTPGPASILRAISALTAFAPAATMPARERARARMAKLVDARDLKSLGRKAVPVRPRLRAPNIPRHFRFPRIPGLCRCASGDDPLRMRRLRTAFFQGHDIGALRCEALVGAEAQTWKGTAGERILGSMFDAFDEVFA